MEKGGEGIALDWDAKGKLLGMGIRNASKRLSDPKALRRFSLETLSAWEGP